VDPVNQIRVRLKSTQLTVLFESSALAKLVKPASATAGSIAARKS